MSLSAFKQNMKQYMKNQKGIGSYQEFASQLTLQYDILIRSGFQTINNIPIMTGQNATMESLVNVACMTALQKKEGTHNIIDEIGKGIVQYWLGAQLIPGPPPVIPAVGAIQNIMSMSGICSNPGTWSPMGPQFPTSDEDIFVDMLAIGIQAHLPTISGTYTTTSLYPSVPSPIPAPGTVPWTGWTVPG